MLRHCITWNLFSCFCLFDECCLSKYKRESYKDLVNRISPYGNKMCWLVKAYGDKFKPEKIYVCCINHASRIMENAVLSESQRTILRSNCLRDLDNQPNFYRSCFYFYSEDVIDLHEFCISCKLYFVSSEFFNLKRIKINDGVVR